MEYVIAMISIVAIIVGIILVYYLLRGQESYASGYKNQ